MAVASAPTNGKQLTKVEIPDLPLLSFTVRLVGTTPLIANRFGETAIKKLEDSQGHRAKHKQEARDPEAQFEEARYRLPDGRDGFPALSILGSVRSAAMRMTELKGTDVLASFYLGDVPEHGLLPLEAEPPKMRTDHVVRMGRGNVEYRPQYWPWTLEVPLTIFTPGMSVAQALNLLRNAGVGIGIGNWRPEKRGFSGKWKIDPSIQVTE